MQVEDLGSVERDAVVCVSAHRRYVRPQESERFVELKANWTRACRQRGHRPLSDANDILFATHSAGGQQRDKVAATAAASGFYAVSTSGGDFFRTVEGSGAESPAGSRGRAPGHGVRGA